jgi:hypothetical protein
MSSGDPSTSRLSVPALEKEDSTSQHAPPSPSASSPAQSKLQQATQEVCEYYFRTVFTSGHDDKWIMANLGGIWYNVHETLSNSGDSDLEQRLRDKSEFKSHIKQSNRQHELINLVRRMAKGEVPWQDLFTNGTFLFVPLTTGKLIILFYL